MTSHCDNVLVRVVDAKREMVQKSQDLALNNAAEAANAVGDELLRLVRLGLRTFAHLSNSTVFE